MTVADVLSLAVLPPAFLYNVFNNIVPRARPDNKQDIYTSIASGAIAGAMFKSTGASGLPSRASVVPRHARLTQSPLLPLLALQPAFARV